MLNSLFDGRRRRGQLTIIGDMLDVTRNGILKTQMMYKANLSFDQNEKYLAFLLEKKLLEIVPEHNPKDKNVYRITSKGIKCLNAYKEMVSCLSDDS